MGVGWREREGVGGEREMVKGERGSGGEREILRERERDG